MQCHRGCSGELYLDTRQFKAHLDGSIDLIYYCGECRDVLYVNYRTTGNERWWTPSKVPER